MPGANERNTDPIASFRFELDTGKAVTGYFSEVSGIGSESDVVEMKITDKGKSYVQKNPGRLKWTDVTLKRGITDVLDIWEWRKLVEEGKMKDARKNCTISMFSADFKIAAQWDFINAWPSKVTGPAVKADSNEFGVEEVVITHEGMIRKKPAG